jgi:hypothetical protein
MVLRCLMDEGGHGTCLVSLGVVDDCLSFSARMRRVSTLVTTLRMGRGERRFFSCSTRAANRRCTFGSYFRIGRGESPSAFAWPFPVWCGRAANLAAFLSVSLIGTELMSQPLSGGPPFCSSASRGADVAGVSGVCAFAVVGVAFKPQDAMLLTVAPHQLDLPAAASVVRSGASCGLSLPASLRLAFELCGAASPAVEDLMRAVVCERRAWVAGPGG